MFARAMHSPDHPIVAQIVPMRRCNLACTYCNEFDAVSRPVPLAEMLRRIDLLAALGTTIITISGGEPMLHPDLDEIIRRIRHRGIIATLITNGYLLTPERIRRLNRAGLDYLQISIDNVMPDETSKKSLKVLDRKLEFLAADAEFAVTVNSVLGSPVRNPHRRAHDRRARTGARPHQHGRHPAQRQRPASPPRPRPRRRLRTHPRVRAVALFLRAVRPLPAQHCARPAQRLALPRRRPLPLHLRGRPGALLLTAARPPGNPPRGVHPRSLETRGRAPEVLRSLVHHLLRAPDGDARRLPRRPARKPSPA